MVLMSPISAVCLSYAFLGFAATSNLLVGETTQSSVLWTDHEFLVLVGAFKLQRIPQILIDWDSSLGFPECSSVSSINITTFTEGSHGFTSKKVTFNHG